MSSIGYVTKTVVTDRAVIDIVLSEDTQMIEETIVVGYGVQRKSEVTGAISSVKAADMENRTISNVEDALQGKTAGVQLISASASPGASPTVRVRGYSSNTTSDPLFVVDGVRMKDISGIDPNDIESMEVLKDAASAAIYGAEAGNGVVLITTKKGKSGDGKVTYSFQYTLQSVGKVPEVMNAEQYAQYMVEGGLMTQDYVNQNWDGVTDTDWAAVAYETGVIQRHNLAVSNGSDKGNYYVSLSWLDNDGLISENDKTMIGSGVPSATFGLTLNAAWKGFDFTLFAQGTAGNDIFCALTKVNFPRSNRLTEIWYDDRWTATNTGGSVPRANSNDTEKYFLSDAMVYDASYLRIKQIQLGYTLPAKIVGKVGIRKARAYVSLEDYFTFTDYVGSDPEMSANSTTGLGVDLGGYPASKKVVFGINVEF